MKVIETGKGIGVKREEYNGIYSLTAQREHNGKWYGQWCRLIIGKDNALAEKVSPVKVVLGSEKQAREVLRQLLNQFRDDKTEGSEDEIPF